MTTQAVLTKTARTGQTITVNIREYAAGYIAQAYVNGRCVAEGSVRKLDRPQGNVTHAIMSATGRTGVGLTAAEAEIVLRALAQAQADHAETQAGRMQALRQEREALIQAIDAADAQAQADFDRLHALQDESCWQVKAKAEAKIGQMLDDLRSWDRAHPEVIAQIKAEQDEADRRFLAGN
jgi:hypothetical protein